MWPFRHREKDVFAPLDDLGRMVQSVLTPELRLKDYEPQDAEYDGYCFVAAVAYRELVKDPYYAQFADDPDVVVTRGEQGPHYWLRRKRDGKILDLTLGPHDRPGRYPYSKKSKGSGYRRDRRWVDAVQRVRDRYPRASGGLPAA